MDIYITKVEEDVKYSMVYVNVNIDDGEIDIFIYGVTYILYKFIVNSEEGVIYYYRKSDLPHYHTMNRLLPEDHFITPYQWRELQLKEIDI